MNNNVTFLSFLFKFSSKISILIALNDLLNKFLLVVHLFWDITKDITTPYTF